MMTSKQGQSICKILPSESLDGFVPEWVAAQAALRPQALAVSTGSMKWSAPSALRLLLTGGDTLRHYPPAALPFVLINNYGPTECTIGATSGVVPSGSRAGGPPSIGCAIANTHVYLLDDQMRPVPQGAAGEIYIGGAGVARGYHKRPDLTAERFIPDPFGVEPDSRLYKTGDLGRRRPDGPIDFLGRIDDQIKIRGYRIEPNEEITDSLVDAVLPRVAWTSSPNWPISSRRRSLPK
jgi:non-ribosomal peptide synthetase component F